MYSELKNPNLANLSLRVELIVRIVALVFKQAQIPPTVRTDGLVPPTCDRDESVDRKDKLPLFDYPLIHAGKGLLANFSTRCLCQNSSLKPIAVRILTCSLEVDGGHNGGPHHGSFLNRQAYAASIADLERSKDVVVRIELPDD